MIPKNRSGRSGFTMIELVIIIVLLGIVAAVAIPQFGSLAENSRVNATKNEMRILKKAIVGDPQVTAGGRYINRGFEGDIGHPPANLLELAVKPDSLAAYDKFTRIGWNGPYIDSAGQDYLSDAWGNAYVYDRNSRTITATGTTPNIVVSF